MQELDAWLLANVFGWEDVEWKDAESVKGWHRPKGFYGHGPGGSCYSPGDFHSNPLQFAQVKRAIEQQGWSWQSQYSDCLGNHPYHFTISEDGICKVHIWEATEELAGCLAIKTMIESRDVNNNHDG